MTSPYVKFAGREEVRQPKRIWYRNSGKFPRYKIPPGRFSPRKFPPIE